MRVIEQQQHGALVEPSANGELAADTLQRPFCIA
jgi:hypothetical protein